MKCPSGFLILSKNHGTNECQRGEKFGWLWTFHPVWPGKPSTFILLTLSVIFVYSCKVLNTLSNCEYTHHPQCCKGVHDYRKFGYKDHSPEYPVSCWAFPYLWFITAIWYYHWLQPPAWPTRRGCLKLLILAQVNALKLIVNPCTIFTFSNIFETVGSAMKNFKATYSRNLLIVWFPLPFWSTVPCPVLEVSMLSASRDPISAFLY